MNDAIGNKTVLSDIQKAFVDGSPRDGFQLDSRLPHPFSIQVQRIEDAVTAFGGTIPPHRFSHHILALLCKGAGEKIVGCHRFDVCDEMALLIPANRIHATPHWHADNCGYMMSFSEAFLLQSGLPATLLNQFALFHQPGPPYQILEPPLFSLMCETFEGMIGIATGKPDAVDRNKLLALRTAELISLFESAFDTSRRLPAHPAKDTCLKLLALVAEHFTRQRQVRWYARQLGVHPNHLNALVKQELGHTARDVISQRVTLEIQYYLHSTSLSAKEIAERLAFEEYATFSRFFKKYSGHSPTQYRRLHRPPSSTPTR